jgi:signal peptidase I
MTTLQVPARGDIVVFVYPGSDTGDLQWIDLPVPPFGTYDYVKRVVGLPGERVEVRDNVVHINGVAQQRSYVDQFTFVDDGCSTSETKRFVEDLGGLKHHVLTNLTFGGALANMEEIEVPPGHVFVMGDNRDHSEDSRMWRFVRFDQITGKAHFIWLYPFS